MGLTKSQPKTLSVTVVRASHSQASKQFVLQKEFSLDLRDYVFEIHALLNLPKECKEKCTVFLLLIISKVINWFFNQTIRQIRNIVHIFIEF